jgi:hypothetical protein
VLTETRPASVAPTLPLMKLVKRVGQVMPVDGCGPAFTTSMSKVRTSPAATVARRRGLVHRDVGRIRSDAPSTVTEAVSLAGVRVGDVGVRRTDGHAVE